MTTLGEMLSKDNAKKLQNIKSALNPKRPFKPKPQRVIQQGDVFKIKATKENGITPKNGELYRWKHFIVIGKLADGTLHCCAAFDSDKNKEYIEPRFEEFFLPVKAGQYPFIIYDSYIDCLRLKQAAPSKLLKGKYEGKLRQEDLAEVLKLVKMNTRHTLAYLTLWGIK